MSAIRFDRGREYEIVRREYVRVRWTRETAHAFVMRFAQDKGSLDGFRELVAKNGPQRLSDLQVIDQVVRLLVAGELVVIEPRRKRSRILDEEKVVDKPAPPPKERKAKETVEDPPTFQSAVDATAQVAVLIAAANAGIPFCEECARLAQQEESRPLFVQPAKAAPTDVSTFPANHDARAQAATLQDAARDGTPFCQECQKLAAQPPSGDNHEAAEEKAA